MLCNLLSWKLYETHFLQYYPLIVVVLIFSSVTNYFKGYEHVSKVMSNSQRHENALQTRILNYILNNQSEAVELWWSESNLSVNPEGNKINNKIYKFFFATGGCFALWFSMVKFTECWKRNRSIGKFYCMARISLMIYKRTTRHGNGMQSNTLFLFLLCSLCLLAGEYFQWVDVIFVARKKS